jgi:hypothetical protein
MMPDAYVAADITVRRGDSVRPRALPLFLLLTFSLVVVACSKDDPAIPTATVVIADTPSIDYANLPTPTPVPVTTPSPSLGGVEFPLRELREEIAIIGVDGSNRRHLLYPDDVVNDLVWLPDGRIAYSTYHPMWRTNGGGASRFLSVTAAVFLTDKSGASVELLSGDSYISLSVSQSGGWLAAVQGPGLLNVERKLTFLNLEDGTRHEFPLARQSPGWAPSGGVFYYQVQSAQGMDFVRVNPGELPEVLMTSVPDAERFLGSDPGFTRFAFLTRNNDMLYILDLSNQTTALVAAEKGLTWGGWAPGGRYFLYATNIGPGLTDPAVAIYDAELAKSRTVLAGTFISALRWSQQGNVLYSAHDGLYSLDPTTGLSQLLHRQEDVRSVLEFERIGSLLLLRNSCWRACDSGPIDTILLSSKPPQTLPAMRFPGSVVPSGLSVYWGNRALVRADADGDWRQLEAVEDSVYRLIAPAPDGRELAFVRSFRGGPLSLRLDVISGAVQLLDVDQTVIYGGPSSPFFGNYYVPPLPAGCRYMSDAAVSPGQTYVAVVSGCHGLILVDQASREWVVLFKGDWCRQLGNVTSLRWVDDTHLEFVATGDLC